MSKAYKKLKEGLENAKEYIKLENEYDAKLDVIIEAYMDGHIDSIEYGIEIDSLKGWFDRRINEIGVRVRHVGDSSNGRTADFDSVYGGSNPSSPAINKEKGDGREN